MSLTALALSPVRPRDPRVASTNCASPLAAAAGFAPAAALALSGPALCRLFTKDPAALAAAAEVWPLVVASQPLNTLAFSVDGLLYGNPDPHPHHHPHPDPNPSPNPNQARATSTTARS